MELIASRGITSIKINFLHIVVLYNAPAIYRCMFPFLLTDELSHSFLKCVPNSSILCFVNLVVSNSVMEPLYLYKDCEG